MTEGRDVYGAAKQLHSKMMRLAERRDREISRSSGAFRLDLVALISDAEPWLLSMVRTTLANTGGAHLVGELDRAIEQRDAGARYLLAEDADRPGFEREPITERPPPLSPDELDEVHAVAEAPRYNPGSQFSGHLDQTLGELNPQADDQPSVLEAEGVAATVYRYPEPGEPARLLDDGVTVVADEAAP